MKTDVYTKSVLTVIAICLLLIAVKQYDIIPSVHAANTVIPSNGDLLEYRLVPMSDMNTLDVRIVDINTYDELNVNIKGIDTYDQMKVNLKGIDTSDELDVNIDQIGGSWISPGSTIPVSIKQ